MLKYNKILDPLLIAVVGYHLYVSPYTKVEESFNIQAIHDVLNYGIYPKSVVEENYDHIKFPGAVPRTFVGSLVLGLVVQFINRVSSMFNMDLFNEPNQLELLKIVRGVLGIINVLMFMKIRNSVNLVSSTKKNMVKGLIGFWFLILLLSQFHILYYSTRTLPNFMVLPIVSFSISKLIEGDMSGLTWLAFAGIIFRLEVGLLATIIAFVSALGFRQSDLVVNIFMLVAGGLLGLFVTFSIDSYFWGRLLIPELVAFKFNVLAGQASKWGVLPWNAYFKTYLLHIFRPPGVLALILPGFLSDPAQERFDRANKYTADVVTHPAKSSLAILMISSIIYIIIMSFQPHKEWRFIIYVIPIFTLQAANGLANVCQKWKTSYIYRILTVLILANIAIATLLSLAMGYISSFNYPGGDALQFVNSKIETDYVGKPVFVHMDVATCMTGVNRFGEIHNNLTFYDKSETEKELFDIWDKVDILITENNYEQESTIEPSLESSLFKKGAWKLIHSVRAYKSVNISHWIEIFNSIKKDPFTLPAPVASIINELLQGRATTLKKLMDNTIIKKDFLYVYERVIKEVDH